MRLAPPPLLLCLLLLGARPLPARAEPPQRFADLGSCTTRAGEVVSPCRVGYRTVGRLSPARDNAVLIPTWYRGRSDDLLRLVGPEAMVDSTRYFVILVDALGNGVSSSPSNAPGTFARLTLGDMVDAQRRLVREHLEIPRLHAVLGFSMGGHQALEWAVSYPEDAVAVVSLLGSPRPTTHDALVLRTLRWMGELESSGLLPPDSALVPLMDAWHLLRTTPARENEELPRDSIDARLLRESRAAAGQVDPRDHRLQLDAMLAHDVAAAHGGSLERAAARVRARLLIVTSPDDRIVEATPALRFGRLAGGRLLEVPSRCGHFALYCEEEVGERVRAFLSGEEQATAPTR